MRKVFGFIMQAREIRANTSRYWLFYQMLCVVITVILKSTSPASVQYNLIIVIRNMDYSKDSHWKKRVQGPNPQQLLKHLPPQPSQPLINSHSKGKIRIQQYEYEQQNLIGQGYTSKVYLGRSLEDVRTQYAIKVVDRRRMGKDKHNMQLLRQEMQVHRQLDHPNIVKCFQIIEKPHFFYFILEYCPHGTLDAFIKKHQKLTESTTLSIMEQILSAYRYLMQNKVLHRDLKPPNILKAGPNWKICDFGFSVIGKKSLAGEINVGTPAYMAPQALQRTYYSPKTDFFSLGVLCYEMLFGVTPWQHKNQKVLLQMMQQQKLNQDHLASLSNQNLVMFLSRSLEVMERRRMTQQEFQEFSFWKDYGYKLPNISNKPNELLATNRDRAISENVSKNVQNVKQVKNVQKLNVKDDTLKVIQTRPASKTFSSPREYSIPTSTCPSQTSVHSVARSAKKESLQQQFSGNNSVIERQLYYCQLILCLLNNHHYMLLQDQEEKELLFTVLGKHASYIVRRIKHPKYNYLMLRRWEEYILTTDYAALYAEAERIVQQIEEKMAAAVKRKSIVTIRVVNKKFDELTYDKHLTPRCSGNIREYVVELLKKTLERYERQDAEFKQNGWPSQVLEYLLAYHGFVKELTVTSEQSRALAAKPEYKDRQKLIIDFKDSKSSTNWASLHEQIVGLQP